MQKVPNTLAPAPKVRDAAITKRVALDGVEARRHEDCLQSACYVDEFSVACIYTLHI